MCYDTSLPTMIMPVEIRRVSHGWSIHERRRKATERKAETPSTGIELKPKAEDLGQIHWLEMEKAVRKEFPEGTELRKMFEDKRNRSFFRRFASGRRAVTLNLEKAIPDYINLQKEYLENKKSPKYNPEFWDSVSPILQTITRETQRILIPKQPTRK